MTLYRQLIIFTFLLFFLLFIGTWLAKLDSTRSFLVEQLESHAQDTATSLGLSVSQYMAEGDLPAAESMVNAVFDRGYYQTIKLLDTEQHGLLTRELDVTIEHVPSWFITLVPLEAPDATANIMAGWNHIGMVYVKSHPGYAYKTLWESVIRMSMWFAITGGGVLIAGGLGLRMLLRPLNLVERQADALCRKKYEIQEKLPRTKELRRMVQAMNRMTYKVKEMFEEQVGIAEKLRQDAYRDSLTGLGNRRYFESQITAHLDQQEGASRGVVFLIQLQDLQELNQSKGFQAGDDLLQRVGVLLQEITTHGTSAVLARMTGGDFGMFVPDAAPWDAEQVAAEIAKTISRLATEQLTLSDNVGHVGAATYESPTTLGRLLSEADVALRAAQQAGPNGWMVRAITAATEETPMGQQQWKKTLERALDEQDIVLFVQSVVNSQDQHQVLHKEVYARVVQEDGTLLNAFVFMPFAERLQLVSSLDRIVLGKAMQLDQEELGVDKVAVNISPTSLQDVAFLSWVKDALVNLPPRAPRLILEFTEYSAVQNLDLVKEFSSVVRDLGHGIGLDHFGQSFSNLGYLQSLRPDYVKIDRAYTGELKAEDSDSQFFVSSLCSVAHSLDIAVIGEGVEDQPQWHRLRDLNLDGIQGYVIDKPKPINDAMKAGHNG